MVIEELRTALGSRTPEEILEGCRRYAPGIDDYPEALNWLWTIVDQLLQRGRYRAASTLLFGSDMFTPKPRSVDRIINAIESNAKVIVLGSAASGKSYGIIWWLLCDWLRDPEWTGIRILGPSASHTVINTFSSLQRLFEASLLKLPGVNQSRFIGISTKDKHAGFSMVQVEEGESAKNVLQGFHPVPRTEPHPVFGNSSRIRVFMDEAEFIPPAAWNGVSNISASIEGVDSVKIICATNPQDVAGILAGKAEHPKGWNKTNPDVDFEWVSKSGWKTIRIDASRSENVLARKNVFSSFMSYEGFSGYAALGDKDPKYWTYGRGFFPLGGTVDQLIPLKLLDDFFGKLIFEPGTTVGVGGCDLAFQTDGDDAILFVGTAGIAKSWIPAGTTHVIELNPPRFCVQLEQFKTLQKLQTEGMYDQICKECRAFGIGFESLALDKTGVGHGLVSLFTERGKPVMGIGWGSGASHTKILGHHASYADELYPRINAEMYFALRDFLEVKAIKASPNINMEKLQKEIIGRRKKQTGRLGATSEPMFDIEQKKEFRARIGFSPDRCDALCMLLHVARCNAYEKPTMSTHPRVLRRTGPGDEASVSMTPIDFSS